MKLVKLNSVGSFVDTETKMVYPQFENDTPDIKNGVSLTEDMIPGEWLDSLSKEDLLVVKELVDYL
jgi:hypothetical protein